MSSQNPDDVNTQSSPTTIKTKDNDINSQSSTQLTTEERRKKLAQIQLQSVISSPNVTEPHVVKKDVVTPQRQPRQFSTKPVDSENNITQDIKQRIKITLPPIIPAYDQVYTPSSDLRIGRIGQELSKDLATFQKELSSMPTFFDRIGYKDEHLYAGVGNAAIVATGIGVLTGPIERARALAQADFASISELQTLASSQISPKSISNNTTNPNITSVTSNSANNITDINLEHQQQSSSRTNDIMSKYKTEAKPKKGALPPPEPSPLKKLFSKLLSPSYKIPDQDVPAVMKRSFEKGHISPYVQAERHNLAIHIHHVQPDAINNPLRVRKSPYDLFLHKKIEEFDIEFAKASQDEQLKQLSEYDRALKIKELYPERFKHIAIRPFETYSHQLEFNTTHPLIKYIPPTGTELAVEGRIKYSLIDSTRPKPLPLETPLPAYEGFQRFYLEPRITSIRQALKTLFLTRGLRTITDCFSYNIITALLPFVAFTVLAKPWSQWARSSDIDIPGTETDITSQQQQQQQQQKQEKQQQQQQQDDYVKLFLNEFQIADSHLRYITTCLLAFSLFQILFTRTAVHKALLYEKLGQVKAEHAAAMKKVAEEFHLQRAKIKAEDSSWKARFGKLSSKLKASGDIKLPLYRAIWRQSVVDVGWRGALRGFRPSIIGLLLYYVFYTISYATIATPITKVIGNQHKTSNPSVVIGTPQDTRNEIIKAAIPATIATTIAQYLAYPFTTIRNYIIATGSPGYVSLNQVAVPIQGAIHVDQYRLPMLRIHQLTWRQQWNVAVHEIKRQAGWKGFWRGSSIIPFVRVPQLLAVSGVMYATTKARWNRVDEVIDTQHFFQPRPIAL